MGDLDHHAAVGPRTGVARDPLKDGAHAIVDAALQPTQLPRLDLAQALGQHAHHQNEHVAALQQAALDVADRHPARGQVRSDDEVHVDGLHAEQRRTERQFAGFEGDGNDLPALIADVKEVSAELATLPAPQQLAMLENFLTYVVRRKEADESSIEELLARTQKVLEESFIGLDRMAEIVLGLRNFARLDEAQFQTADIDEGIRQTLMILGNNARDKGVTLVSALGLTRPHSCFPAKLNQVVLNLVNNAIDACQRGGEVAVRPPPAPTH